MLRSMCNNFRKWKSSYRVFIVFLSVLVFTFIREDYLRQYAQDVGLAVTPYFFAFQMDDGITRMLFYFGVVLLFCNAPFMDDQQMFVLVRTGAAALVCRTACLHCCRESGIFSVDCTDDSSGTHSAGRIFYGLGRYYPDVCRK